MITLKKWMLTNGILGISTQVFWGEGLPRDLWIWTCKKQLVLRQNDRILFVCFNNLLHTIIVHILNKSLSNTGGQGRALLHAGISFHLLWPCPLLGSCSPLYSGIGCRKTEWYLWWRYLRARLGPLEASDCQSARNCGPKSYNYKDINSATTWVSSEVDASPVEPSDENTVWLTLGWQPGETLSWRSS